MITVQTIEALRLALRNQDSERIAFVPTMGNLHPGHLALVAEAQRQAKTVVVSIFVNPLQFGPNEDLAKYPRTLTQDQAALKSMGVDILFHPDVDEIYPNNTAQQTQVDMPGLVDKYCGASRPGHFVGVLTVVCKLLHIVQPHVAVFGRKDYQQLLLIRRMVDDLFMPVKIIGVDTVRESDGLALSSRNQYLSENMRSQAPLIYQQLQMAAELLAANTQSVNALCEKMTQVFEQNGFSTDYVAILDATNLMPLTNTSQQAVIIIAAYLGETRLIDNQVVDYCATN